ncbi:MAG: VWA domain-containing protein [Desulfofustis sp.]|nr:VWA domain-containing protein [Desulfofustis sp.]
MSFLSPWYLLGLLGIGIPLAIHLIRRQQAERVVLPTARFLQRAPKKLVYFQKLQQLLLLALRIAIIGLLAFAFARPIFSGALSTLVDASPQSSVILLDTSMSMRYGDRFDQGKAAVISELESLRQGDEAAIVTFADSPAQVQLLTTDLTALKTFVETAPAPGYRPTHFLSALHLADQILQSAHYQEKSIVLVSDYQRSALPAQSSGWKLSPYTRLKTIKVGEAQTENLSITGVSAMKLSDQDQETHRILGRVKNSGSEAISEVQVVLTIDGSIAATRSVALGDRSEAVVEFPIVLDQVGLHRCTLRVAGDRFEADNTYYFTIRVEPPMRVLCIAGRSSSSEVDKAYWLRSALDQQAAVPFQVDVVGPRQLVPEALPSYAVVVLMEVATLTEAQIDGLKSYVRGGGGLMLVPDDRAEATSFNREYADLTPVLLQRKHLLSEDAPLSITQVQRYHSIVRSLQDGGPIDFSAARFHGYWGVEPVAGSEVVLRFENGAAALVASYAGNGRVLFFASSLDPEWNNFPRQVMYLPLVHEAMRHLAGSHVQKTVYQVGEFVPFSIAPGGAARIISPQGEDTLLRHTAAGPTFYQSTEQPGFYETRSAKWSGSFAVNAAAQESDLSTIAVDDIEAQLSSSETSPAASATEQMSTVKVQLEKSQRSWWWLLLMVLGLGIVEIFLANRTYR